MLDLPAIVGAFEGEAREVAQVEGRMVERLHLDAARRVMPPDAAVAW